MLIKKEKAYCYIILFLTYVSLLPSLSAAQQTCDTLFCASQGKTCVSGNTGPECVDFCNENQLAAAEVGGCSLNMAYCGAGGIVRGKCEICGCPQGGACQLDGTCEKICPDGTIDMQCSSRKPFYCQDGSLVKNALTCGCDEGKVPQSDGSCGSGGAFKETTLTDFSDGTLAGGFISNIIPKNLAPEGTAFASSSYSAPSSFWFTPQPSLVNDGTFSTGDWISGYINEIIISTRASGKEYLGEYIGIEWEQEKTFNEVSFVQSFLTAFSYKIQYFKDDNWVDATKEKPLKHYPGDFAELNQNFYPYVAERAAFEPVTSKKVRIVFPICHFNCGLYEMEVYNTELDSVKIDAYRGSSWAIKDSKIFNTKTTKNNATYNKLYFSASVEKPKKAKSVNIASQAKVFVSSNYPILANLYNETNLNDEALVEYVKEFNNFYYTGWRTVNWQNQYVTYVFPEKRKINKLVFRQSLRHAANYEIQAWNGNEWKVIVQKTPLLYYPGNYRTDDFVVDYRGETEVNFDTVETSQISILFPVCYYGCYLNEVLVYGEGLDSKPNNIAREGTAIASSTYPRLPWISKDFVNDGDTSVVGGNTGNVWLQGTANSNDWIGIEWQAPRTINKVKFIQAQPKILCYYYYHLQYWDGIAWKDVNRAFNKGTPDDFGLTCTNDGNGYNKAGLYAAEEIFEPVTTIKIRILPEPNWYGWAYVKEIEAYEPENYQAPSAQGTSAKLLIRSAPNNNGIPGAWTAFTGPDGTSNTFYETSGQDIPSMHDGNKFIQYRAVLSSTDPNKIVSLDDVKIDYAGQFNIKPIVTAKDREGVLGTPISFSATANDIGGSIISYNWDFGDGTNAVGKDVSHNYAIADAYNAKVTVTDNDGENSSANVKVFVNVYDCLSPTDATPKGGPAASLFTPADSTVQQKAREALLEYAQIKGINVRDIDTSVEYYEATNSYVTRHMTYAADTATFAGDQAGWDGVPAKRLFEESAARSCGNDYCGDCEDFAITTTALIRAMGVSPKCAYTACSRNHCYNVLNINSKFRIVEPQNNNIQSAFHSKSYEWVDSSGRPNYGVDNIFNDEVGVFYEINNANPATYTTNYPGTSGLPDSGNKCPPFAQWSGGGDRTYYEDVCA